MGGLHSREKYKNWVKAASCLTLVKKGLEEYADAKSKQFHTAVLANVAKSQPAGGSFCDSEIISFDKRAIAKITCNHPYCLAFLQAIVQEGIDQTKNFTIQTKNIKNCDVKLWHNVPWELAKLFMNPGQTSIQQPHETDLSGILNFLDHCLIPRNGIQHIQFIDAVRQARNVIMHTADMQLNDTDFQHFTQSMVNLLRDPKELATMPSAQEAAKDILKISLSDFQISLEDESVLVKDLIAALQKATEDTKTEARELKTTYLNLQQANEDGKTNLHTEMQQMKKETKEAKALLDTLEKHIGKNDHLLKTFGSEMKKIHDNLKEAQKDSKSAYKEIKCAFKEMTLRRDELEKKDCRKLRQSLVKEYSRLYKDISVSPFGEELNDDAFRVPIDKIYCDLDIVKIKGKRQTEHPTGRLNSYSEMFADTEIKNIVIKGEGGTGKSTWCKRLLHAWCQVQRRELEMEGASDETNSDMAESLKRFDYLFFVTLRHINKQLALKDIFLAATLERLSIKQIVDVCELILATKSENVLFLLDGFDEYPFTLDCQGLLHSTIVMTTRPWKYDVLRSRDNNFKVDAVSEIRGLTSLGIGELSRKVIASYSKQYPDMGLKCSDEQEQACVFLRDIKSAGLSNSIEIPLILIITVLTWLENKQSLSKSLTCNILGLLEVIFRRGKNKLSQTDKQALKRAEQEKKEPSAIHEGLTAKYKFMCDNQVLLQNLGRLAYKGLTDQQKGLSLVFSEDELHEFLDSEELEICYKLGLLTGSTVTTSLLNPPQVSISFYHKLFQELFAAIGIISDSDTAFSEFTKMLTSLTAVLEMENVILFITALNPCVGSDISKHNAGLAETKYPFTEDREKKKDTSYYTVELYSKLIFKCLFERDSIHDRKEQKPLFLRDLELESDIDRKLHLCTYLSGKQLKSLRIEVGSSESVNIKQMFSQLAKLTAEAASLQFLYIDLRLVKQKDINTTTTTNFALSESVHLETVTIKGITLSNGQNCLGLTFGKTVQLRTMDIENTVINMLYLQNITRLELRNAKLREIRLPTRLEKLEHVILLSTTMPGSSWNSFFQSLQSPSLTELTLKNLNIDDITINLENSSGLVGLELEDVKMKEIRLPTRLQKLELEDVKMKEIRLPTGLKELWYVRLQSVTMPESSWNSFFQCLQLRSETELTLKNLNIDDITINLENISALRLLKLEDVKIKEIRLQTGLKELWHVRLQSVTMPELSWNSFFQCLHSPFLTELTFKNLNTDVITINIENISALRRLKLEDVKMKKIILPTRLEQLKYVRLKSVTMPGSSWNSFFRSVQSAHLNQLTLKNSNIDDITINLENISRLRWLELEDVKIKEIRLPTRLNELWYVRLQSVTMPESSWNSFCQPLQFASLTGLILKNLNIDEIKLPYCKGHEHFEISNMKLAEIDSSNTEILETIKADKVALPELQASSFFNQDLLSTRLGQLTMKDISLGEEIVQFDKLSHNQGGYNLLIQLENVIMSKKSYECLCTLLKRFNFNENQVTKHSIDRGLLNVTFFGETNVSQFLDKELLPDNF